MENRSLTFDQVYRLKTACACYEVIPSVLMAPIVYQTFKLMVTRYMTPMIILKIVSYTAMSDVTAVTVRDAVYWPIVAKVYAEVHGVEQQKAYQSKQALQLLSYLKF